MGGGHAVFSSDVWPQGSSGPPRPLVTSCPTRSWCATIHAPSCPSPAHTLSLGGHWPRPHGKQLYQLQHHAYLQLFNLPFHRFSSFLKLWRTGSFSTSCFHGVLSCTCNIFRLLCDILSSSPQTCICFNVRYIKPHSVL